MRTGRDEPSPPPPPPAAAGPHLIDRAGARAYDRAAIERLGIPGIVLMELAACGIAARILEDLGDRWPRPEPSRPALLLCGPGNNGGDGFAIARHLLNAGVPTEVRAFGHAPAGGDAATERAILERMGVPIQVLSAETLPQEPAFVVDALFGTGLDRPLEGAAAAIVDAVNRLGVPVIAVDLPSGLDADGAFRGPTIRADATFTLVAPKPAMRSLDAQATVGLLAVVPIGVPPSLLAEFGRPLPPPPHPREESRAPRRGIDPARGGDPG
jgi:hydroxyethylthiazole kinase-like uncharacterized protein yjeF